MSIKCWFSSSLAVLPAFDGRQSGGGSKECYRSVLLSIGIKTIIKILTTYLIQLSKRWYVACTLCGRNIRTVLVDR